MHRRDKSSAFAQQILRSNSDCPEDVRPKVRTNIEVLWSCTSLCNYFFAIVISLSYADCAEAYD